MQSVPITTEVMSSNPVQTRWTRYNINADICGAYFHTGQVIKITSLALVTHMTQILTFTLNYFFLP